MKTTVKTGLLAAAFCVGAQSALAGGLSAPVMDAPVVAAQTAGSSGGVLIPLLILILVAVAVASSGSNELPVE